MHLKQVLGIFVLIIGYSGLIADCQTRPKAQVMPHQLCGLVGG